MINLSMDVGEVENCDNETLVITIRGAEERLLLCQEAIHAEMVRMLVRFRAKDKIETTKKPCGCGQ